MNYRPTKPFQSVILHPPILLVVPLQETYTWFAADCGIKIKTPISASSSSAEIELFCYTSRLPKILLNTPTTLPRSDSSKFVRLGPIKKKCIVADEDFWRQDHPRCVNPRHASDVTTPAREDFPPRPGHTRTLEDATPADHLS